MARDRTQTLALIALALAPATAFAQPRLAMTRLSSESMEQLIARLDSRDAIQRQQSEEQLTLAPGVSLDELLAAASDSAQSPERQLRLTRAAYERFASTPRGALGISFQRAFVGGAESGAVIEGTFEGFDSHRVLKPGDTIYSMDDIRIRSMDDGKRVIQAHDPGERVTLRVFREGQPIIVRLTLGSLPDLDRHSPAPGQRIAEPMVTRDAFRLRLERTARNHAGDASSPVDLTKFWASHEAGKDQPLAVITPVPQQDKSATQEDEAPTALSAGGRQGEVSEAQFDRFVNNPADLQARTAGLMRQLAMLDNQMQMVLQQSRDPNLGAERRARALNDVRILQEKRARIKQELESLQPSRPVFKP